MTGHIDEVLDINFNSMGTKLVTASADRTARVYNITTGNCISVLHGFFNFIKGHDSEVSKAVFNP